MPARVDEDQLGGPDKLAQIEADDAARQQASLDEGQFEIHALGADQFAFHPGREQAGGRAEDKKRHQRRTSRRQESRPRCHQKITSSAAGKVAVTVLLSRPNRNSKAPPYQPGFRVWSKER